MIKMRQKCDKNQTKNYMTILILAISMLTMLSYGCIDQKHNELPPRIYIEFNENVTMEKANDIVKTYNCSAVSNFSRDSYTNRVSVLVKPPEQERINEYLEMFRGDPDVYNATIQEAVYG